MNKVVLIGRLVRDPDMRTVSSGASVTRFTVAVDRPVYNSQNGNNNNQPQADFISCVAWRKQAENIAKYCKKGSQVAVEGRIQTGSYDGKDGVKHYTTDVLADNVTFLSARSSSSNEGEQPMPDYNESQKGPQDMPTTDVSQDPFKDFGEEVALSDDDLPF